MAVERTGILAPELPKEKGALLRLLGYTLFIILQLLNCALPKQPPMFTASSPFNLLIRISSHGFLQACLDFSIVP
jgi:hypothetical protein